MRFRTVVAIGLCLIVGLARAAEPEPVSDVRVLIDMSGSMKRNDPHNLRVPALRLLTQLMPEGTRGGVWTFGRYVNMLVPKGEVDDAWKEKAYAAAAGINSLGLFTNIGAALDDATWDWRRPDPSTRRTLILLTDGLVDISKDPARNAAERKRILEELLPKLKQGGVVVNTIGLSGEADKAFLHQLSAGTGGWHQDVSSAAELERVFLRMFEKSVPTETLPLVGNKIRVDSSVLELTLLVFRGDHGKETAIVLPSGKRITHADAPDNVRWRREARYDLVTVDHPPAGEWTIDAELDPDNRVMVVTNMRVKATRLPNTLLAGSERPYFVSLLQDGKVIDNPLFLDLVNIELERHHGGEMQRRLRLNDDGHAPDLERHDGTFSALLHVDVPAGEYEYFLKIDGGTFQRAGRQIVQVVDGPVAVSARKVSDGNPAHYALTIVPYSEIIDPETLEIDAVVAKEGVGELAVEIPRVGPSEWRLDMNIKKGDLFKVKVKVAATTLDGERIERDMGAYAMGGEAAGERVELPPPPPVVDPEPEHHEPPAHHEPVHHEPVHHEEAHHEPAHHEEVVHHEEPAHHEPAHAQEEHHEAPAHGEEADHHEAEEGGEHADEGDHGDQEGHEEPDWMMVIVKVVGLNVVLIDLGGFVWWKWFRTPRESEGEDGEEPVEASEPAGEKEAPAEEKKEEKKDD